MVAPNLFGFIEGYRAQQNSELADAEEQRRQEAARQEAELQAKRNTLFDQAQQEFLANQQLREAERALNLQRAAGGLELLQVTQPNTLEAARFTGLTDAATRAAMTPVVPQLAKAGAQTLFDRVMTAQTQAGTARTQADLTQSVLNQPGVLDALRQTQVSATETAQAKTALGRLIAQQDLATASDPQVQLLARTAQQVAQETQMLNDLMQLGRMDAVNQMLQRQGMEAKMVGAVPMIRPIGQGEWQPWAGAMSLPFYRNLTVSLENVAQAREREQRAAGNTGQAPVAALGLGVGATPTPLAGRAAPAQPGVAPVLASAPTPAPPPAQPRLNLGPQEMAALVQAMREAEARQAAQRFLQLTGR